MAYNAHELTMLRSFSLEPYLAVFLREQSVIATNTNVGARVEACTTLPNEDIARQHFLATIHFDAKSFGL